MICKDQIETPALLIDLDALERNIRRMADYLQNKRAKLRPHFKTHKCPEIARMQLAAGAKGITCAKLSEAEILAGAGIQDILIANEVVESAKIERLARLALGARIGVAADNEANIRALSAAAKEAGSTLHALVEVNVGMGRCGVDTPEEALALASLISGLPGLEFEGIQAYEGHLAHMYDAEDRRLGVLDMVHQVAEVKALLEARCLQVKEISGGATGTYDMTGDGTIWTEIQAGSYVFMDTAYGALGLAFENALTVLATVVHKRPGVAIADAGMKTCSTDGGLPALKGIEGASVVALHEEHGAVYDERDQLHYLQKIEYIPGHCCTTVNLYDKYHCMRGGVLEAVWNIAGRGKSQ
jgi:D-serine deaminase-like pyridoxal phosphate-dependent protein